MRDLLVSALLLLALGSSGIASAQQITEFPLPWSNAGATELVAGSDSALWFIEANRNRIGRITMAGVASDIDLQLPSNMQLSDLTPGPDGNIWFTAAVFNGQSLVGSVSQFGTITKYPLGGAFAGADGVTTGTDGTLWFTAHQPAVLGQITTNGSVTPWGPTSFSLSYPTRIAAGTGDELWIAEQFLVGQPGGYSKLVRWNVRTHASFEHSLPAGSGPITDLCLGPDGNMWFVAGGGLPSSTYGYITPSGQVGTFSGVGIRIASGGDGNLWVTDPWTRVINRVTPSGTTSSFTPPSTSGTLWGITSGPDGNIWYADGDRIGRISVPGAQTLSVPAAASIHGAAGAFFHTDLWVTNRSYSQPVTVTATYYCYLGTGCYGTQRMMTIPARQSLYFADVIGKFLGAPETAGPIQLSFPYTSGPVTAFARVYTPSLPAPTFGASVEAVKPTAAKMRTLFIGLASNASDLSSGFRSNAGVFNPSSISTGVIFVMTKSDGTPLGQGQNFSITVPPLSAVQINDVFARVGAGSTVVNDAMLVVIASVPVHAYVTVIDNQSGDFIYVPPSDDEWPLVNYSIAPSGVRTARGAE